MIKFITALASMAIGIAILVMPATAHARTDCARSITTSGSSTSVSVHINQSCGRSYRAIGFWGGGPADGYHYGTYHLTNGDYSTACGDSACDVGNVQWGGYQRKTDGKIFCVISCSAFKRG